MIHNMVVKDKVLVLGYFGFVNNQLDGQTVKTRSIYELLKIKESELGEVTFFDTQELRELRVKSVTSIYKKVFSSNKICYIPAHNSITYFFPVLFLISLLTRKKIFYFVVGGWLSEFLTTHRLHAHLLKNVNRIFAENQNVVDELQSKWRFCNVGVFPNFRAHSFTPILSKNSGTFNIVFFARVDINKGLEILFDLAAHYSRSSDIDLKIHVYGPINATYRDLFLININKFSNIEYHGVIDPSEVHSILTKFDVLVLPTRYYTEGFPGSVLDAYISGVPVIVTKWKHANEFVDDGITGYIVSFEDPLLEMIDRVNLMINDRNLVLAMKKNASEKSKEFSMYGAWNKLALFLKST